MSISSTDRTHSGTPRRQRKTLNVSAIGGLLAALAAAGCVTGSNPVESAAGAQRMTPHAEPSRMEAVAGAAANVAKKVAAPVIAFAEAEKPVIKFNPDDRYYEQLRARMRWMDIKYGEERLKTPDVSSRLLLAQSAARKARLEEVGLNFRDVYGIINAETSWIPRTGASKDGTPNLGIAQFEPATAKALGLRDPHDPVEAVHVAALHLKQAAAWSAKRIADLKLSEEERAAKLREGISIYYNLSTKGRNRWNGMNTAMLPIETQRHISNARRGAREAADLEQQLASVRARTQGTPTFSAALPGSSS